MLRVLSFLGQPAPENLPCRFALLLILAQRGDAPDLRHAALWACPKRSDCAHARVEPVTGKRAGRVLLSAQMRSLTGSLLKR